MVIDDDQHTKDKNYCLKIASSEIIKAQLDRISDGVWGLEMAAELHDLGKIGIPDNILNKPAKLNPEEFDLVKEHPKRVLNMIGEISVWLKEDIILGKSIVNSYQMVK